MSNPSSPTRYYASRSNSRAGARPTSPQNRAELRSQAVAKLKRAASLPRNADGKRPQRGHQPRASGSGHVADTVHEDTGKQVEEGHDPGPWQMSEDGNPHDAQEILSPSPTHGTFDHLTMYPDSMSTPGGMMMHRTGSSSTSYQMTTPPHLTMATTPFTGNMRSPYHDLSSNPTQTPDWAAMHLAQSYIPSLSPAGISQGHFTPNKQEIGVGRHTPSPLPTLGELRSLQRSNSAAARAQAMSKLTGGRDTPSDDGRAPTPLIQATGLHRAGTLGAPRFLGMNVKQDTLAGPSDRASQETVTQDHLSPRPRLQRSFTVSSSNMGEERRSAVGRRMVMRLAERREARQEEEAEVRRLWEQRRAGQEDSASPTISHHDIVDDYEQAVDSQDETDDDDELPTEDSTQTLSTSLMPPGGQRPADRHYASDQEHRGLLNVPDRPTSRGTTRSTDGPFQYESHLSRSLSTRTAKMANATVQEEQLDSGDAASPHTPSQGNRSQLENLQGGAKISGRLGNPHLSGQPVFSTPTRPPIPHFPSNDSNLSAVSPGESIASRDALGSMMFIVGGGAVGSAVGMSKQSENNWPSEVEENGGSDWGTPGKDTPIGSSSNSAPDHSPLATHQFSAPPELPPKDYDSYLPTPSVETSDADLTPPGMSQRTSVMSWEEVGGPDDRTVPSDSRYHKKSGSLSAKLGRNIRTAMRKRSQSRSSASSSLTGEPLSPNSLSVAIQNFGRRGSESSVSPSSIGGIRSMLRQSPNPTSPNLTPGTDHVRHQPSISSLSPSLQLSPAESVVQDNTFLRHQLVENPSQVSFIPRADINDPRVHHSKLSPFPGIAALERNGSESIASDSKMLIHQSSDSAVRSPSQDGSRKGHALHQNSIQSLPTPDIDDFKRVSDESSGKRSWIARALGQQVSPRHSAQTSSISMSRQNSSNTSGRNSPVIGGPILQHGRSSSTTLGPVIPAGPSRSTEAHDLKSDPFAAPPAPVTVQTVQPKHRSASPSVSVVPEVSEEGSRLTRFTANTGRAGNATPLAEEQETVVNGDDRSRNNDFLKKVDELLGLKSEDPKRPDFLDDPPRKLLLAHQVLQVVNAHTVKDRFLLLFNDILVIAKPIFAESVVANLDNDFVVKSVIPLDRIQVTGFDAPRSETARPVGATQFIKFFADDPVKAVRQLREAKPNLDTNNLASLLLNTPELNRGALGTLLVQDQSILNSCLDKLLLPNSTIVDGLKRLLLLIRFPQDGETLLENYAKRYFENNSSNLPYSSELATELVFAAMQLNDQLWGVYDFAPHNPSVTADEFISTFRARDPHGLVPEDILHQVFSAVQQGPLQQALTPQQSIQWGRKVTMSLLPSKLSYGSWSDTVIVTIPAPDSGLRVKLLGHGLEFDPPNLDFTTSREAKFKIRGRALGNKTIILDRLGSKAALYSGLVTTQAVKIERAFMAHTFQLSYTAQNGTEKRYCFSISDARTYARWANHLPKRIKTARQSKTQLPVTLKERSRNAAEMMAFQVLRNALITEDEWTGLHKSAGAGADGDQGGRKAVRRTRSGSVSVVYATQRGKKEDQIKGAQHGAQMIGSGQGNQDNHLDGADGDQGVSNHQTGKELVLLCRQNSLLPDILEILQPGFGGLGRNTPGPTSDLALRNGRTAPLSRVASGRVTPAGLGGKFSGRATPTVEYI